MIILIGGASHTGKTALAQKILEKYHYPYLSIDHLKMGLIRSANTTLTPSDDNQLTDYLWPILREIIKTAIENQQNLVLEGCYIPFSWQTDFEPEYLQHIQYFCLVMSEEYIKNNFSQIKAMANVVETRLDDEGCTMDVLIRDNKNNLEQARKYKITPILIEKEYDLVFQSLLKELEYKEGMTNLS